MIREGQADRPRARFEASVGLSDAQIDLCEAALWVAAEEYPELDVASYLDRLDALAASVLEKVSPESPDAQRLLALNRVLFDEEGFTGNRDDYYDPRNSYLNEVLDRRVGIPITLSLVHLGVAQRVGLSASGVSFPGHFLTRIDLPDVVIIDPFIGEVLDAQACRQRLAAALPGEPLRPEIHLRPARPREILVRLLSNLKAVFLATRDLGRAVACIDRILIAMPEAHRELRDRGLVYEQLEYFAAAASDLELFLERAPDDESAAAIAQRLQTVRMRLRIH